MGVLCRHPTAAAVTFRCAETRETEDRLTTFPGLKWHLARLVALGAHCIEHLARTAFILASVAACLAALGSREVAGGVKFLLTLGESKVCAAVAARYGLVCHTG